jgi:UDP-sugar diphosphatase
LAQEGEFIDVVEMTIPEIKKYITQEDIQSPGGFLFGVYWFLANKYSK